MTQFSGSKGINVPIWFFVIALGMLFPPIISMIISLLICYIYKDVNYLISFTVFFVLFLTYNFFSIDNIGRFNEVYSTIGEKFWYLGNPLSNLMRFGVRTLNLQCSHFFYVYIISVYLLFLGALKQCYSGRWNLCLFLIFVTTISLRNSMDLLYYCLATTFMCYYITRKEKLTFLNYLVLIVAVYLIHPGLLIILLPAVCLNFIIKNVHSNKRWIYYLALIFIYCVYFVLSTATVSTIGIPVIDAVLSAFSSYTSDSYWGMRDGSTTIAGASYIFMYYIVPGIYFILFIISVLNVDKIRTTFLTAVFQSAMLMYPNFINYVTFTERTLLVLSITFILLAIVLFKETLHFSIKWIVLYCLLIFTFTCWMGSGAVRLSNVFEPSSYNVVRYHSYYMPSALLLDYKHYGFSDEFLKQNTHITF